MRYLKDIRSLILIWFKHIPCKIGKTKLSLFDSKQPTEFTTSKNKVIQLFYQLSFPPKGSLSCFNAYRQVKYSFGGQILLIQMHAIWYFDYQLWKRCKSSRRYSAGKINFHRFLAKLPFLMRK